MGGLSSTVWNSWRQTKNTGRDQVCFELDVSSLKVFAGASVFGLCRIYSLRKHSDSIRQELEGSRFFLAVSHALSSFAGKPMNALGPSQHGMATDSCQGTPKIEASVRMNQPVVTVIISTPRVVLQMLRQTIGNDGFRWFSTIGPTMEWLPTIVEV